MFQVTLLVFSCALLGPVLSGGRYEMPFGCRGKRIDDRTRQGVLILINGIRSSVALGDFKAMDYLPPASDMVKLLIHATTASVGCYQATCNNRASVACVFSEPQIQPGMPVYTTGNSCNADDDCKQFKPAYCESGLSVNAVRPSTTPPPTTSTTPTTTTTTTTTSTTTTTTTRRKSTDCPSPAFTSDFRETALGAHNNFRSKVATGKERNAEHAGEFAPPSSLMELLAYDCTAEEYAHRHVVLCDKRESQHYSRPGYEENIHILSTTETTDLGALQNAILTWTSQLSQNGIPSNMDYTLQLAQRVDRPVTSVSKVLWGNNRYVGCATHVCPGFYFTSCMYKAPVNVIGEKIYALGGICDNCPHGPNNCDKAVGLCSW